MNGRYLAFWFLLAAAVVASPAPALAADWYVRTAPNSDDANPCTRASPCATITRVVDSPAVVDGDTIHLGRGFFTESVSTAKRLNFVGTAGRGSKPVVEPTTGPAFTLRGGGSMSNLQVYGDYETLTGAILLAPERAGTYDYSISDVIAIGGKGVVRSGTALEISDDRAPGATINTHISGGHFDNWHGSANGISVSGSNVSATLTGISATVGHRSCCGQAVSVSAGAEAFLDSSRIGDNALRGPGLYVNGSGSRLRVARSRVSPGVNALTVRNFDSGAATATVVDSLIANVWGGQGALVQNGGTAGATATLEATGTTFVVCCNATLAGLALESHGSGGESRVAVTNTIIRATPQSEYPGFADRDVLIRPNVDGGPAGSGVFTATYSNFRPAAVDQSNGGAASATPPTGTNLDADPLFVAYGDFQLRASSPVIDRGDPSIVKAGQLDLAGNPRSLDGNLDCIVAPDMGAYERTPQAGPCSPGQPSSGTTGGGSRRAADSRPVQADTIKPIIDVALSRRVFRAARRGGSIATAAGTTVRYTLSERARVRFTIERAIRGRKVGRRCAKPRRRNRNNRACRRDKRLKGSFSHQGDKGANRFKLTGRLGGKKLKRGRYRLVARATDPAGNRSARKRAAFRIVRR